MRSTHRKRHQSEPDSALLKKHNTTFKGDVIRLLSGTSLAQIISLLAAPILTRLYAPEAFGIYALFASIIGIFSVLACMRYELSILLPDNDREAANLLAVSFTFAVLTTLLALPLVWYGSSYILIWLKTPELAPYLWLVPVVMLVSGIFMALNSWNTRTKHFTRLSIARIIGALANTSGSLGAGFANHATSGALIVASLCGQAVATTVLSSQIWRDNGQFLVDNITLKEMWTGIKRYHKFPLYSSWSSLLNMFSLMAPILMFGAFFSSAIAGFYVLGFRVLQTPLVLVSGALSEVFYQRASLARLDGTLPSLVKDLFRRLLLVGLLPCLILTITGKDLFTLAFGINWAEAGFYTQLLAPWILVWFVSSSLSTVYIVLEQQQLEPIIQGTLFLNRVVALAIGGYIGEARLAVLFFSFGSVVAYAYLLKVILNCVGLSILTVLREQSDIIYINCLFVAPIALVKILDISIVYNLVFIVFLFGLYFFTQRTKLFSSSII